MASACLMSDTLIGCPQREPVVLVGLSGTDLRELKDILVTANRPIIEAPTVADGLEEVRRSDARVAICGTGGPGNDWRTLLDGLVLLPKHPRLIVCSRLADEHFWAEVLNLGGWDVLAMPFVAREVIHSVSLAS